MSTDQITQWERDAGHSRAQARRSNPEPLGDYATMGFQARLPYAARTASPRTVHDAENPESLLRRTSG